MSHLGFARLTNGTEFPLLDKHCHMSVTYYGFPLGCLTLGLPLWQVAWVGHALPAGLETAALLP